MTFETKRISNLIIKQEFEEEYKKLLFQGYLELI